MVLFVLQLTPVGPSSAAAVVNLTSWFSHTSSAFLNPSYWFNGLETTDQTWSAMGRIAVEVN